MGSNPTLSDSLASLGHRFGWVLGFEHESHPLRRTHLRRAGSLAGPDNLPSYTLNAAAWRDLTGEAPGVSDCPRAVGRHRKPRGLNWAKRSEFPGQRVTFTKPWRERRRSHPGRVRRLLEAAPRMGAFDLVREYAPPKPSPSLCATLRQRRSTMPNQPRAGKRHTSRRLHLEISGPSGLLAGDPRVRGRQRQRAMRNRRRRLLGLRAVPAVAGHGYCAPRRAFLRAKGSPPSSRAAPGATSMTRTMLMKLMSRCRPTAPRENAYSMSAPTAGPAIAT